MRARSGSAGAHRIVSRGHHVLGTRFQIPQAAERADDPPAAVLEDCGDVRVRGRGLVQKTWPQALGGAIHKDPLEKKHVDVEVQID